MKLNPNSWREAWIYQESTLTSSIMNGLFRIKWSPQGSNHYKLEKKTVSYWLDFLEDIEMERKKNSLKNLHMFSYMSFWFKNKATTIAKRWKKSCKILICIYTLSFLYCRTIRQLLWRRLYWPIRYYYFKKTMLQWYCYFYTARIMILHILVLNTYRNKVNCVLQAG